MTSQFYAGKTELVSFGHSNNPGEVDIKLDGSVSNEKNSYISILLQGFYSALKLGGIHLWRLQIVESRKF